MQSDSVSSAHFISWKCTAKADVVYIIAIHAIWCSLTGRERYKEVSGVCKSSSPLGLRQHMRTNPMLKTNMDKISKKYICWFQFKIALLQVLIKHIKKSKGEATRSIRWKALYTHQMEFPRNVEFNPGPKSQQSHVSETRIAADLFFNIRISILKAAYRYSKEVIWDDCS